MQTPKTKSGCGCGGRCGGGGGCGCSGGGGCGCKPARLPEAAPALCLPCETASFVRPRFFAGQLLTEDDLEALTEYTLAKNRFHNARLFGDGVVCGLTVECGPCDSTQIVVQPGYALDCCGNDLVLTCPRTLDLAPMIRELQTRLRGRADCADPCPPVKAADGQATEAAHPIRKYCLYAVYAERQDQPVTGYPVGDDCGSIQCQPTRILEGISFELRCPTPPALAPTYADRKRACFDRLRRDEQLMALFNQGQAHIKHLKRDGSGDVPRSDAAAALDITAARITARLKELAGCSSLTHTDCTLRELVEGLSAQPARGEKASSAAPQRYDELWELCERVLEDCLCDAINPPCPTCDDQGVLLACFEVDRCKVVRICNTDRRYVLAPSTLRYWGSVALPDRCNRCAPAYDEHRQEKKFVVVEGGIRRQLMAELMAPPPNEAATAAPPTPPHAADHDVDVHHEIAEMKKKLKRLEDHVARRGNRQ